MTLNDAITPDNIAEHLKWWFDQEKLTKANMSADEFRSDMMTALENIKYVDDIIRKFMPFKANATNSDMVSFIENHFDQIFSRK